MRTKFLRVALIRLTLVAAVTAVAMVVAVPAAGAATMHSWTSDWSGGGPTDVAVGGDGMVHVIDGGGAEGNPSYQRFDRDGNRLARWPLSANAVAAGPNGQIYLLASGALHEYDASGALVRTIDYAALAPGPTTGASDVVLDGEGFALAFDDTGSSYGVFRFTAEASRSYWTAPPATSYPRMASVAVGPTGTVFLLDRNRVVAFGPDGSVESSWGTSGSADGQLRSAKAIAVDQDNRVYLSDGGFGRIQRFTADGSFLAKDSVGESGAPSIQGMAISGNDLFAADPASKRIYRLDLQTFGQAPSNAGSPPGGTGQPPAGGAGPPAPPSGHPGVSIEGGARFTNSPDVALQVVWPFGSTHLHVSNDGGFRPATRFAVGPQVSWTLDSSGPERLPKTIYVRFEARDHVQATTFQDDIILDETRPRLLEAELAGARAAGLASASGPRRYQLRLKAADATSGVSHVQVARSPAKPMRTLRYRNRFALRSRVRPRITRVRDRAGNWSRWRRLR